ncbi:M6PR [Branchiostoma lanceolatum]|uniref:Autophagy-related protein 27 n=1 Tax=Branchiostoma lanceolatum TaxID=7740 RepID=A0A8J9VQB5_BRALA|nr:M6PR [Branchiostoma lanceolatum]
MASITMHRKLCVVVVILVLYHVNVCIGQTTCDTIDSCSCTMSDGSGVVNLRPLVSGTPTYKDYSATQVPDDYLYSWSPCTPFTEAGSDDPASCTNVAVCQVSKDATVSYGLGTQDSAAFTVTSDPVLGQTLNLVYTMPQGGRVAGVTLQCSKGATTFSVTGEVTTGAYAFELSSPCACPGAGPGCAGGGLSGGSVFLIILFALAGVYVIAGAIFMKFVKGAQGSEVIPNVAFWKSLPGYVKDGVFFILSPCRGTKGYDSV